MATKSTNKTIWTLALVGVLGFLTWKLWPAIKKKIAGAGGSSAAGAGPIGAQPYQNPYEAQQQGQPGGGLSFGGGSGAGGGLAGAASNLAGLFQGWLSNVVNTGQYNAQFLGNDAAVTAPANAEGIDAQLQPLQLFDVNQLAVPLGSGDSGDDSSYYPTTYSDGDVSSYAGPSDPGAGGIDDNSNPEDDVSGYDVGA